MNKLIDALITLVEEYTLHLRKQNEADERQMALPLVAAVPTTPPDSGASVVVVDSFKAKKPRGRPKSAPKVEAPTVEKKELTSEESSKKLAEVATSFVARFQRGDDVTDGQARAKKIMKEKFNVVRLGDLTHSQRVELISLLEVEMVAADKDSAPVPVADASNPLGV